MKTTRSIDDIFDPFNNNDWLDLHLMVGEFNCAHLTKRAKQQLLATILASMPEKKEGELRQIPCPDGRVGCLVMHMGSDKIKSERDHGWNAHNKAVEQAIKKIFESKEGK